MDYTKHIKELSWEIYLKGMNVADIESVLTNLFELGKNAGKMELNGTNDIKIDTVNPFNY